MAVIVTYTATASGRCWKQHTCSACSCVYRYVFERTAKASGGPGTDVRTIADHRLAIALRDEIDDCPCPCCGLVQPDMVGRSKYSWHFWFTLLSGVLLLFFSLPAFVGS